MTFELKPDTYQKILDAERKLTDSVADLSKAEQCGVDCQNLRQTLNVQLATIQQIKANFAPKQFGKP